MDFKTYVITNSGGRINNEDYADFFLEPGKYGAWILADGLGGHNAGEMASKLAVKEALAAFRENQVISVENIKNVIHYANDCILSEQAKEARYSDMKSTLVGIFTDYKEVIWAHVGDSRMYLFKKGLISFQTKDHSVSQYAAAKGEISFDQIRFHEDRNRLLRVLGADSNIKLEVHQKPEPIMEGDAFLLCSDGFWEYVNETEMEIDLAKSLSPDIWLELMCTRLLSRVDGNNDNFTAIGVFII